MFLSLGLELLRTSSFFHCTKKTLNQRKDITQTRAEPKLTKMANRLGFRTPNHMPCQMTFTSTPILLMSAESEKEKKPTQHQKYP